MPSLFRIRDREHGMVDEKLANAVVRSLSEYLVDKGRSAVWDARLENLLSQVETKLSHHYGAEMVARFRDRPNDNVEANTLRIHLVRAIAEDPEFGKQLASTFGGKMGKSGRKWRTAAASIVAVAALGGVYLIGRVSAPDTTSPAAPTTVTSTVEHTVSESAEEETTTTDSSSTTPTSSSDTSGFAGVPGDGSTFPEGQPVPLVNLPRPNDEWHYNHGDHDVQFKQHSNSLWFGLGSCDSSRTSRNQQFRLTNFSRIEVKAIGTDSKADPGMIVKFDVFANNDEVNPIASIVVNPGETKEIKQDLPADVFALTLRVSLTRTGRPCQDGNAVWGEPYVIAAGN
jgi:hypothetical protein